MIKANEFNWHNECVKFVIKYKIQLLEAQQHSSKYNQ